MLAGKRLDHHPAKVVAGGFVFAARIAETGNERDGHDSKNNRRAGCGQAGRPHGNLLLAAGAAGFAAPAAAPLARAAAGAAPLAPAAREPRGTGSRSGAAAPGAAGAAPERRPERLRLRHLRAGAAATTSCTISATGSTQETTGWPLGRENRRRDGLRLADLDGLTDLQLGHIDLDGAREDPSASSGCGVAEVAISNTPLWFLTPKDSPTVTATARGFRSSRRASLPGGRCGGICR
jgi:hypothetical protein